MKIIVCADLHDNLANLDKCLQWNSTGGASAMIIAGDLTNKDTLDYLAKSFSGQIYLARGNACNYDPALIKNYPNIIYLGRDGGVITIENKKIGVCHEEFLIKNMAAKKPEIIFYGHSHKPWSSKIKVSGGEEEEILLINPGTLAGMNNKATFAVYDTAGKEPELKLVEQL